MTRAHADSNPTDTADLPGERSAELPRWAYVITLLVAIASFVPLAWSPFHHPDEFNYITAARDMLVGGDWITPHFNGGARVVKPILFYWIVAGAFKVFGVHILVARLCSAAAAMVGVLLTALAARHLFGRRAAPLAALIAATQLCNVQLSRFAVTDTTLFAFAALSNYAFIRLQFPSGAGTDSPRYPRRYSALFFSATALALLTKGPIALLWCGVPFLWILFDLSRLRRFRWLIGMAIVIAILAPWTTAFILANAGQLRATLLDVQSKESYAQFARPVASLGGFFAIIPLVLASVVAWLPALLAAPWRERSSLPVPSPRRFLLLWTTALLLTLAFAGRKDIRYLVPLTLPLTLLLTAPLLRLFADPAHSHRRAALTLAHGLLGLLICAVIIAFVHATRTLDTRLLWVHLIALLAASALLLAGFRSTAIQRLVPALLAVTIYFQIGLLDLSARPIAGDGPATLAPRISAILSSTEPLVIYGMGPRYLIYLSDRLQVEAPSEARFAECLTWARAVLVRESDWQAVPADVRSRFAVVDTCIVQRRNMKWTFDLAANRERALLLARVPATQPGPASPLPPATMPRLSTSAGGN